MSDFYRALRVMPSATPEQIASAYARERTRVETPGDTPETSVAARLTAIEEAYVVLGDPERRAAYDRSLGSTRARASTVTVQALVDAEPEAGPSPSAAPLATITPSTPSSTAASLNASTINLDLLSPAPTVRACPNCGNSNPVQATICSSCGGQMTRPCPYCGQPVALSEAVCPRCHTVVTEYDQRRFAVAVQGDHQVQEERRDLSAGVEALEASNAQRNQNALIFWLVALALFVGVIIFLVSQVH